jgi:haloalkane dehalogenase
MTVDTERRPAWLPTELYPFADHWAEIEGNHVHYLDEGSGPPLLLLSGNPGWSFGYRRIIERLRDRFRCIAPDYPGFGLSRAAAGYDYRPASHSRIIEQLVDRLRLDGLTIMGYDWGGPIGLGLAARRPERVRALVIGNTWAWPAAERRLRLFAALMGGPLSPLLVDRLNLFLNLALPGGVRRRRLSEAEKAAYHGPFPPGSRRPMGIFPREIVRSRRYLREVEAGLQRLARLPVLIVWADQDPAFRESERERFERLFPRHRTVMLWGAGHQIDEDAPDEIADAIGSWWDDEVNVPPRPDVPPQAQEQQATEWRGTTTLNPTS